MWRPESEELLASRYAVVEMWRGLFRKVSRSIHEDVREMARELVGTDAYARSRNDRKKVEMLFTCGWAMQ